MNDSIEPPDVSHLTIKDMVLLMRELLHSRDPSDQAFIKALRDEIARQKPK